jgi:hypothetical protein
MKISFLPFIIAGLFLAGCASNDPPPPHMERVEVLIYDKTPRPRTASVEMFDAPPARANKVIAFVTCSGDIRQEVLMKKSICYKARQLGADAVVFLPTDVAGGRRSARANAIVFEPGLDGH